MSETLTKQRSYLVEFTPEDETDYAVLHALPSTDKYVTTNDNAYIGHRIYQTHGGAPIYYSIRRLCVYFDTSSIPAIATVTSATLKIQFRAIYTNVAFDVVIQNGQPDYPHNPIEEADYYYDNYSDDEAVINTDDIVTIAYNSLVLPTDWVTKAGETKVMIRGSHEIAATAPTPGPNTNQWVSCGANKAGRRPTLVVVYDLGEYPIYPVIFPLRT